MSYKKFKIYEDFGEAELFITDADENFVEDMIREMTRANENGDGFTPEEYLKEHEHYYRLLYSTEADGYYDSYEIMDAIGYDREFCIDDFEE